MSESDIRSNNSSSNSNDNITCTVVADREKGTPNRYCSVWRHKSRRKRAREGGQISTSGKGN